MFKDIFEFILIYLILRSANIEIKQALVLSVVLIIVLTILDLLFMCNNDTVIKPISEINTESEYKNDSTPKLLDTFQQLNECDSCKM